MRTQVSRDQAMGALWSSRASSENTLLFLGEVKHNRAAGSTAALHSVATSGEEHPPALDYSSVFNLILALLLSV